MKNFLSIYFILVIVFNIQAQVPQKFNYQAVARNAQGDILPNRNIKLKISILDGSASGPVKYSETHSPTTSSLGLFTLAVGAGAEQVGNFTDIQWASADKYIKVEMDPTGGNAFILMGTSQLLSVPYALNAGNGSRWSKNGDDIYYNNGNVGIGVDNPTGKLHLIVNSTSDEGLRISDGAKSNITIQPVQDGGPDVPSGFQAINFNGYYNTNGGNSGVGGESLYNFDKLRWRVGVDQRFGAWDHFFIDYFNPDRPLQNGFPFLLGPNGFVGLGMRNFSVASPNYPKSRLHLDNGDIFIEEINKGVIMKSPNGQCWRMTVSNNGQPVFTSITCP